MGCTGVCGAASKCELELDVGVYKMIDLGMEQPELNTINNEPIIKVTHRQPAVRGHVEHAQRRHAADDGLRRADVA